MHQFICVKQGMAAFEAGKSNNRAQALMLMADCEVLFIVSIK